METPTISGKTGREIDEVSGLAVFPEKGKPKGSRVQTAQSIQQVWMQMQQDDSPSARIRAGVQDMIDGAPPWKESVLRASGAGFRHNLNFGEGAAMISQALTAYNDLIDQVDVMIRPELPMTFGDPVVRSEVESIIADAFTNMIRDWDDFHFRWQMLSRKFVTHGVAIGYFCDEWDWKFWPGGWDNMWMPRMTEASEDKVDILVTQKDYLPSELYAYIQDEKSAKELGWNPEVAKKGLVSATRHGGKKLPNLWGPDWMELQKRLKNNDITTAYKDNVSVETLHAWVREYDGTYSHYISLKYPLSANEDFLYKSISRYPKASNVFTIFTFDIGNGHYHGIKGYGYQVFPFVQISNRLRNGVLDSTALHSKVLLQPKDGMAAEEAPITVNGPFVQVSPEWNVIEHTFPDLSQHVLPIMHDFANQMDTNVPIYRSRITRADNKPATKFEQQAKIETDSTISGASVNMFYRAWRRLLREIFRRVQKIIENDMLEDYPEVAMFVRECAEMGVDSDMILAVRRVTEERSVGNGSPQQRLNAFDQGMQMIGTLDETGRKALIRSKLVALFGQRKADEFMPADRKQRPVEDQKIALLENSAMFGGGDVPVLDGENHSIHAQVHFGQATQEANASPSIANAIQQLENWRNNGEQGSVEELTPQINFLAIALPHTEQHVQAMGGDPTRREQAGAARKALQEYAAMWMTYMRQLNKAMQERQQAEAEAQAQAGPQIDPVQAEKINTEKLQQRLALERFQTEQTMKVKEVEQRMMLAQREADVKMATEIHKGTVKMQNEALPADTLAPEAAGASSSGILTNARFHAGV